MATKKPIANANPDIPKALTASETAGEATPTATAKKSAAKTAVKAPARPTAKTSPPKPAATPVPAAAPASLDALMQDGQATMTTWLTAISRLGQGAEEVSAAWSTFYRGSVETGFAAGKDLLRAKSLTEAIELQRDYTTRGLETLVTEATKLTEISVKAAGAASAPVVAHYDQTLTRWRQSIAA
ncbi:MAG: phasin family protein [Thalassobaculaceae bacterium]